MITETNTRKLEPDITIVEILGRLNLGNSLMTVENSIQKLIGEGVQKLVIDLAGLIAIDSSGVGMIVTLAGHIEKCGGRLRVAGAKGGVAKTLELVHLERIAPVDPDVESACRYFSAEGATA